jgi:hypothetical protein
MSPTRPPHGQPVTLAAAPRAALATELLQLCERFFTDRLAFATYHPEPGE